MDDILWGYHSHKNSLTKLLRGIIYFPRIYKKGILNFCEFIYIAYC